MNFELHISGNIIKNSNYDELKKITITSRDEFIIYQIFQSKMNLHTQEPEPIKKVKYSAIKNPPMLSYKDAQRASEMYEKGKRKSKLSKEFHEPLRKISRSIEQYNASQNEEEYKTKTVSNAQ